MAKQLYARHNPSGEIYVLAFRSMALVGVNGPLEFREVTEANLGNFEVNIDDIDWAEANRLVPIERPYPGDGERG